jgi:hypothetical protein
VKLFTKPQIEQLKKNGAANAERVAGGGDDIDFYPVVKLFTPDGAATWLLSEIFPDDPDIAFGLCDLGVGCPEFGTVRISELESARGPLGLPIERDLHFKPTMTIGAYGLNAVWDRRIKA